MNTSPFENGKLLLKRTSADRQPLIDRLNRIEGQVRGLKAMIEADRYCGDELHQIKAAIAALRRVAMLVSDQHVAAAARMLGDTEHREMARQDIMRILSDALAV